MKKIFETNLMVDAYFEKNNVKAIVILVVSDQMSEGFYKLMKLKIKRVIPMAIFNSYHVSFFHYFLLYCLNCFPRLILS